LCSEFCIRSILKFISAINCFYVATALKYCRVFIFMITNPII